MAVFRPRALAWPVLLVQYLVAAHIGKETGLAARTPAPAQSERLANKRLAAGAEVHFS